MPDTRYLVTTMAAGPEPPGGTMRHAWLLVAQWEPEKKENIHILNWIGEN